MKNITWNGVIKLVALGALAGFAAGCASPAKPEAMVPRQFNIAREHPYTTSLSVTGGKETNPMGKSEISSDAFAQAVADSIERSGVFTSVIDGGGSDYKLDVSLVEVISPTFGFDMTVTAVTEWRLTEVAGGNVVSEESISTPFTATVGDAFAGVARLRLANEGAAKANIKEGIRRLSELQLAPGGSGN